MPEPEPRLTTVGSIEHPIRTGGRSRAGGQAGAVLPTSESPYERGRLLGRDGWPMSEGALVAAGFPADGRVAAFAAGWADGLSMLLDRAAYCDSGTGLATPAYLAVRLGEVYRRANHLGVPASDLYELVLALVAVPEGLDGVSVELGVVDALATTFPAGETLARLARDTFAVLAEASPGLALATARLRRRLRMFADGVPVEVWPEPLPDSVGDALELIRTWTDAEI